MPQGPGVHLYITAASDDLNHWRELKTRFTRVLNSSSADKFMTARLPIKLPMTQLLEGERS